MGRVHQFGTISPSWSVYGIRFERGENLDWCGNLLTVETEDLNTVPPSEIHVTRFKSKGVDIQTRDNEFVFPCRTGEIVQEGQPLRTAVHTLAATQVENLSKFLLQKKKPDIQIQMSKVDKQDFGSIMVDYMCRNHVAPRTKLNVPKGDFVIPLNCMYVPRQTKTIIDVPQEATRDDEWIVDGGTSLSRLGIGVTTFKLLLKNPPEGHAWLQGRLTKKQVTTRPGNIWLEKWSNMSKSHQRKA